MNLASNQVGRHERRQAKVLPTPLTPFLGTMSLLPPPSGLGQDVPASAPHTCSTQVQNSLLYRAPEVNMAFAVKTPR